MISFLAKAAGNKSKIEKRILKKKEKEDSIDEKTTTKVRKEVFEAAAAIKQKHAPFIPELEQAADIDEIENIIQSLEDIELGQMSPAHAITQTSDAC
jgi:hypothetical protein